MTQPISPYSDFSTATTRSTKKEVKRKSNEAQRVKKKPRVEISGQQQQQQKLPKSMSKYWNQRHDLWYRFEEGIQMDIVTPERIAQHIASRCKSLSHNGTVIDAFCGVGGNTVQFAKYAHRVIAVDNNARRISYAKHNAAVYGVAAKIDFLLGDFFECYHLLKADVIFLSPPWGGPNYTKGIFSIKMLPIDLEDLLIKCREITQNIVLFLPRSVSIVEVGLLAGPGRSCEVEQILLNGGKVKAICVYFGDLAST